MGTTISLYITIINRSLNIRKQYQQQTKQYQEIKFPFYLTMSSNNIVYSTTKTRNSIVKFILQKNQIIMKCLQKDLKIWRIFQCHHNYPINQKQCISFGTLEFLVKNIALNLKLYPIVNQYSTNNKNQIQQFMQHIIQRIRNSVDLPISSQHEVRPCQPQINTLNNNSDSNPILPISPRYPYQTCRICSFAQQKNNPLLSLCKCKGSIKYIHYGCFRKWILDGFHQQQTYSYNYYQHKKLLCQICKQIIPNNITYNGKTYSFIPQQNIFPPFVKLQRNHLNRTSKYLIRLNQGIIIKVGSSIDSNLKLKHPTIANQHCQIFYKNKKLHINSYNTQFGTSVLITPSSTFTFKLQDGINLRIGESIIQIKAKQFNTCLQNMDLTLE